MHCFGTPSIHYAPLRSLTDLGSSDLLVSAGILDAIADRLPGLPANVHTVTEASIAHWENLLCGIRRDTIYAIGG